MKKLDISFVKMHSTGNDFVIVNNILENYFLKKDQIIKLADRHYGVGCDQVLILSESINTGADFRFNIFNPDGQEVEQCGNGARCIARYAKDQGLTSKKDVLLETISRVVSVKQIDKDLFEANMGKPEFNPSAVPINAPVESNFYNLEIKDYCLEIGAVNMGNTHAITRIDDVNKVEISTLGPEIENHTDFPLRANVEFMEVVSRKNIRVRVYERGVGETLACGSGACAAAVYGKKRGWLDDSVTVEFPGGKLNVIWKGGENPVMLSGLTEIVFEGKINL